MLIFLSHWNWNRPKPCHIEYVVTGLLRFIWSPWKDTQRVISWIMMITGWNIMNASLKILVIIMWLCFWKINCYRMCKFKFLIIVQILTFHHLYLPRIVGSEKLSEQYYWKLWNIRWKIFFWWISLNVDHEKKISEMRSSWWE